MKKYGAYFTLRFSSGLQYRAEAIGGTVTQFAWGFMMILLYHAFYRSDSSAFPMTLGATVTYVWLNQGFLALYAPWNFDQSIFDDIMKGNVAYDLSRPLEIYSLWFAKISATRLSRVCLRCMPIFLVAVFLPNGYNLSLPAGITSFLMFIFSLILALILMCALSMLVYISTFYTYNPQGVNILFISACDFLAGSLIPLPFFPQNWQRVLELLPFASIQNVPYRIYSGDISGGEAMYSIMLQLFWIVITIALGKYFMKKALKKIVIQGG